MNKFVLCAALALSSVVSAQSAKQLNSQGMDLYKQQDWDGAIASFRAATRADPRFALAHYNLACTLSLVRKERRVCDFDAYRHVIVSELEQSVKLDPKRRDRMKKDRDLDPIRDTVGYQLLLGVQPGTKEGLTTLLQNVSWWAEAEGAFGNRAGMKLLPGGKLQWWELQMDDEGAPKKHSADGSWQLVQKDNELGQKVWMLELSLPKVGASEPKKLTGYFNGRQLVFKDAKMTFTDEPAECGA